MPQSRSVATAIAMALLLAVPWTADRAGADDAVRLTFDWPETVRGRATVFFDYDQNSTEGPIRLTGIGEFDFSTSPAADARRVEFGDSSFEIVSASDTSYTRLWPSLSQLVQTHRPDFLISEAGDFEGIVSADAYNRSHNANIADAMNSIRYGTAAGESVLTDESVTTLAEHWWGEEVGLWTDKVLAPGAALEREEAFSVPFVADLPAVVTQRLIGRAPCLAPNGCVELEVRTVVNSPDALAAYEDGLQPYMAGVRVEEFRIENSTRIVADPDTLLPYRHESTSSWIIRMRMAGELLDSKDTSTLEVTYDYD